MTGSTKNVLISLFFIYLFTSFVTSTWSYWNPECTEAPEAAHDRGFRAGMVERFKLK